MRADEIAEVLSRPLSRELLARDVARFETTLPSAVEELLRQRDERRRG